MSNPKKNQLLWKAFVEQNEEHFNHLLDIGAKPDEVLYIEIPEKALQNKKSASGRRQSILPWAKKKTEVNNEVIEDPLWTTFEYLCGKDEAKFYLEKCIEYGTHPNKVNSTNGQYPIHIAVLHLKLENIKILLKANADCASQTYKFDKTPLHLLVNQVNDFNVKEIFEIIKVFVHYKVDFSWPAHRNDGETPFSLLLALLAELKDKTPGEEVIRYLIQKYPDIDKFHEEKCATLIQQHFQQLSAEYERVTRKQSVILKDISFNEDWVLDLCQLLESDEASFLHRFKILKQANRKLVEDTLMKRQATFYSKNLLDLSIEHDRFVSFVEIFNMTSEKIDIDVVVRETLVFERYRILQFLVNLPMVERISESWFLTIMEKINWRGPADTNSIKCFDILLNSPKFDIRAEAKVHGADVKELRYKLNMAAAECEATALALMKRGADLSGNDSKNRMLVEYLDVAVLKNCLDSCVTVRKTENMGENDFFVVMDYSILKSDNEMEAIEHISTALNLQPLIVHPVISSFLFLKWFQLSQVFWLNLLIFTVNIFSTSLYAMIIFVNQNSLEIPDWACRTLYIAAIISFSIFVFKEVGQLVSSTIIYLKSIENYLEMGLIGLTGAALFVPIDDESTRRLIAAIIMIGLAFEWTLMFSALPMFMATNYIVMLKKVAINFLRMLAFYSMILLAFSMSFYTIMESSTNSTSMELDNTFFHTILMMTGEFGMKDMEHDNMIIMRVFLVIFMLSITIVLMNLLLGLTISDTAAIESHAEQYNWIGRAELLRKYEKIILNCCKHLNFKYVKFFKAKFNLLPKFLPMNKIKIEIISHVSDYNIHIPRTFDSDLFKTDSRFPSNETNIEKLTRSFFAFTNTIKIDERIVKSAMEILERRAETELQAVNEKKQKAYQDDIEDKWNEQNKKLIEQNEKLSEQSRCSIEQNQKLDNLMKRLQTNF